MAAFLLEYLFYLAAGVDTIRQWLASEFSPPLLGLALGVSGVLPYLVYSLPTHQFHWTALVHLAALAFTLSLWYVILPRTGLFDLLFLSLAAAVMLRKFFDPIFTAPFATPRSLSVLGHLMLIHLGVLALLVVRRLPADFGFIPTRAEWAIGIRNFLLFLPIAVPVALMLHLFRLGSFHFVWWRELGIFLGSLWVVSLSEEFFFRGVLLSRMRQWMGNSTAALLVT